MHHCVEAGCCAGMHTHMLGLVTWWRPNQLCADCRAVYPKGVGAAGLARFLQEANKEVEVWLQVGTLQAAAQPQFARSVCCAEQRAEQSSECSRDSMPK